MTFRYLMEESIKKFGNLQISELAFPLKLSPELPQKEIKDICLLFLVANSYDIIEDASPESYVEKTQILTSELKLPSPSGTAIEFFKKNYSPLNADSPHINLLIHLTVLLNVINAQYQKKQLL